MVINQYEHTLLKNDMLPEQWRSQRKLDELEEFLQQNWIQRSYFYDDGNTTKKQQFLTFTSHQGVKTKNYIGTSYAGKNLGTAFKMKHDILVEIKDKVFILDTKYKQIPRFEYNFEEIKEVITSTISQADIYQVCEYARKRDISDVYLLYPLYRFEENEPSFPYGISKSNKGDIKVHFIRIPFIFEDDEEDSKKKLKEIILELFNIS